MVVDSASTKKIDIFIDSKKITTLNSAPWTYTIEMEKVSIQDGSHILKVVAYDNLLNQGEDMISFVYKTTTVEPILNQ
jgi:hypothetical protein